MDRESVPTIFSSQSTEKRDRDQNVVHSLREGKGIGAGGAEGAEVKRGIGAVGAQAQVGKIEEGKGSKPGFYRSGSGQGPKAVLLCPQTVPPSVLARPLWRMTWMKQSPRHPGSVPLRGRKEMWSALGR